jgi:hypothetical protein
MDEKCIICDGEREDLVSINDTNRLMYCNNCFHITCINEERNSAVKICKELVDLKENYAKICLNKIKKRFKDTEEKINILCINDFDTHLMDRIKNVYKNAKTVSLSPFYNPSFFSRHYHDKDVANSASITRLNKKFDKFDFIFINTTLNGWSDPNKFLELCKKTCNNFTWIVSINYHSVLLSSYALMNLNSDIIQLFNTNSMKMLCENNNLNIIDVTDLTSDIKLYTFTQNSDSKTSLSDILYDEITHDTYSNDTYDTIKYFWTQNYIQLSNTLEKYKRQNFTMIGINKCNCCDTSTYYKDANILDITCNLNEIKNTVANFNKSENFLFIIFDYKNFFKKSSKIAGELSISKSLILDPVECICYPIY